MQSIPKVETWKTPSIKVLFDLARQGTPFTVLYPDLIHSLVREDEIELDKFLEPPTFYDEIPQEYYTFVACAVHYHFSARKLAVPD